MDRELMDRQLMDPDEADRVLKVTHIISGDRWAGAEVQAYTLLRQLKQHARIQVILLNEGELAKRCRALGLACVVLDERRLSSLRLLAAMIRQLRKFRPDVVHTHRQKENVLGTVANLVACRSTSLRTVHGAPEFAPTGIQKFQVWLDRWCGRHLQQAVIAVSAEMREKLSGQFSADRVHYVCNGIDVADVRENLAVPDFRRSQESSLHVGLVGRLDPVKRIDLFLEMAALLISDHPRPWQFHIFGEGALEDDLRQHAEALGISNRVRFHGHRSDIRSCIAALDAMVMPSDHEGLPMAALECLALGTRLLAHDTGGLSELLADSPACLVEDHSPRGYARALVALIDSPHDKIHLAPEFLANSNGLKVLSLYQRLLRPPRGLEQNPLARR